MTITIGSVEQGHYVLRAPHYGMSVAVPLRPIGNRIGGIEVGAVCDQLGYPEVSGRLWNKIKKKAKKAVKKTLKVAKKIAKNKLTKKLYSVAKSVTPAPFSVAFVAAEAGAKIARSVKGGSKKGRNAAKLARALAGKKISLAKAKRLAAKKGIPPNIVRDGALMLRLKPMAKSNPKLAAAFSKAAQLEQAANPAQTRRVKAKSGRVYEVSVRAA